MELRVVTCPETAHLELIECEDTPFGMLIVSCSFFRGTCVLECPRTCAARLDQRAPGVHDNDEDVLGVGDETSVDVLGMLRKHRDA